MDKSVIEENIASARARLAVAFQRQTPPAPQELIDWANVHFQTLVNQSKIARYDDHIDAEKIIASGRFKAMAERDAERSVQGRHPLVGPPYTRTRLAVEKNLFGIPETETDQRPIYGYLFNDIDGAADAYGEVKFVLRDSIRSAATLSRDDSLISLSWVPNQDPKMVAFAAVPFDNVTVEAIVPDLFFPAAAFSLDDLLRCRTLDQLVSRLNIAYFEVQIHAPVGIHHIERIAVKRGIILSKPAQQWATTQRIPVETRR